MSASSTQILDADVTASSLLLSVQLSVLVSLRYLQTAVEGAMALEEPEGDSDGYLLEKGVKETFEEVKVTVLTMLKMGQVDPTAEGAEAEKSDAEKTS